VADRRTVGLDLGERRIGVALCDSGGLLATPYEVLARSGDRARDHRAIAALVEEASAVRVVVGLPRSLDGSRGTAEGAVLDELEQLRAVLPVPVFTHDERLTTVTAERSLRGAGLDGRRRRQVVDQVAAAVILQAWLDAEAAGGHPPTTPAPDRSDHA
jgi:putative Holliday junction resolvase